MAALTYPLLWLGYLVISMEPIMKNNAENFDPTILVKISLIGIFLLSIAALIYSAAIHH